MIRITQLKFSITQTIKEENWKKVISKALRIEPSKIQEILIVKKSIDARKKNDIKYIYTVDVSIEGEEKLVQKLQNPNIAISKKAEYQFQPSGKKDLTKRPIIVGTGPAGMFCGLFLAEHGYRPIIIERGDDVDQRVEAVNKFWSQNHLNVNSNVQFGEGGAGTFSDGKLNTLVKDPGCRNRKVLEEYVKYGAPSEILYQNKPHIGTDRLQSVVKSMRERIKKLGGDVLFQSTLTDICVENHNIVGVSINHQEPIPCSVLVLAIGHSARDTFELLYHKGLTMEKKSFAIGVRIEHPQELISNAQYGSHHKLLPPADYKVTHQASNGRSVYSFCMCPGGFVVNSSSEEGRLVVNGMSNYKRDERNANSALIVSVRPDDFQGDSPLSGIEFQRHWEEMAYKTGRGLVPVQLLGDFIENEKSESVGAITPNIKGGYLLTNIRECLPSYVSEALIEGVQSFEHKIHGFSNSEAILSGVETRTSSPVRIIRDENFQSNVKGIYPCGEGAGYAGGITSAAMDGIKVFEAIASQYQPMDNKFFRGEWR